MQAQEFPLTPAMRTVIVKENKARTMLLLIVGVIFDVVLLLIAVFLFTMPGGTLFGAAIIVVDIVITAGFFLYYRRLTQTSTKDLTGGVYQRLTGPMRTGKENRPSSDNDGGTNYFLIYGGHRQRVDQALYDKVTQARVSWGTIEETPNGHVIFTVRDANGQLVYHHPEYQPEEITAG
ncbi:MAG TPA: hypothetical protein VFZ25_03605 [Chloroflexota bacterium]|nr:hypothetical protein [Chloroflexota bacterium]